MVKHFVNTRLGRVPVTITGEGPTVVFVHGMLVNSDLWLATVDRLQPDVRCVVPDLPLGAHEVPADPRTELTLAGIADLVAALLDALDLSEVTVVGNDSGGAITQLLITRHPERIRSVVLTTCELFDNLPPRFLAALPVAARSERLTYAALRLLQFRLGRRAFLALFARTYDDDQARRFFAPAADQHAIRQDLRRLLSSIRRTDLRETAPALQRWGGRVDLVWGQAHRGFFPVADAKRLVAMLPDARLVMSPGSATLVPLDDPGSVARTVREAVQQQRAQL